MNEIAVAVNKAGFAHADGFDFRSCEDDACSEDVDELVVERGSFVLYVDTLWFLIFFHAFLIGLMGLIGLMSFIVFGNQWRDLLLVVVEVFVTILVKGVKLLILCHEVLFAFV